MAGVPGRSGGHNKLPADVHLLRGTFRGDRHGQAAEPTDKSAEWSPTKGDLAGLGRAGRALLSRLQRAYEFNLSEGLTVVELAHAADVLATLRAANVAALSASERATHDRQHLRWSQYCAALLRELRIAAR